MNLSKKIKWIFKPIFFIAALIPLGVLTYDFFTDQLSANPISDITHETGIWALRFFVLTLAVTPIRKISGWGWIAQFRKMIGLFAFFYALLHFTTYVYLDQFFDWDSIVADVRKRPFITVGFASFVLLIPLAITSLNRLIKWLGSKRWKALHRLVYVVAIGGVIHYYWLVKADIRRPLIYGAIVLCLLAIRFIYYLRSRASTRTQLADG